MKELEAKFEITGDRALADLELPGELMLSDQGIVKVQDDYLDTPDLRLARHGYVIRIRRKNGQQLITLKSFSGDRDFGLQDRLEIERTLVVGTEIFGMRAWPREIRKVAKTIVGKDARWQPICTIVQSREKHIIHLPDESSDEPTPLAELSIDDVKVQGPAIDGPQKRGAAVNICFGEVEIELLTEGLEPELEKLADWLGQQEGIQPIGGNKLMRGLRAIAASPLTGAPEPAGIQPAMQMADACRLLWRQQTTEMVLNEAGVRADADAEFVHEMRVATRRARSAHILFGDFLQEAAVQSHLRFFKRSARRLGRVRDLDVALENLAAYRKARPKGERAGLKPLAKLWRKERKSVMARLLRWLDSDAYALALIELDAFCTTPGMGAKQSTGDFDGALDADQVRFVLPSRIYARFEGVRRYETLFEQDALPQLAMLHALRIDCKHLRYVLEFSRHLLGEEGEVFITQLRLLQDILGDLNDADVARLMLQDLPNSLQDKAVKQYVEQQGIIIGELRQQVGETLAEFVGYQNRQLLAAAVARI